MRPFYVLHCALNVLQSQGRYYLPSIILFRAAYKGQHHHDPRATADPRTELLNHPRCVTFMMLLFVVESLVVSGHPRTPRVPLPLVTQPRVNIHTTRSPAAPSHLSSCFDVDGTNCKRGPVGRTKPVRLDRLSAWPWLRRTRFGLPECRLYNMLCPHGLRLYVRKLDFISQQKLLHASAVSPVF